MAECTGLENRRTARYRGFKSLSLRFFMIALWRCGRAVIQRIANPSVPFGLGRFNSCRLRQQSLFHSIVSSEIVAQLD